MTGALTNHILRQSAVKPSTRNDPIAQGGWGPSSMLRHLEAMGSGSYW